MTFTGGGKSARLCRIEGGDVVAGYGEEYGVVTVSPSYSDLGSNLINTVVAYGALPDGREVFFGIRRNKATGTICTVTTENLTLEEFAGILAKVYDSAET